MDRPLNKETKQTKREAIEVLRRQGIELDESVPSIPKGFEYIWSWFAELSSSCERITYCELKAWQELKGRSLYNHEIEAIMSLDKARRSV